VNSDTNKKLKTSHFTCWETARYNNIRF